MKDGLISAVWQPACEPLALSPREWENLLGQARQTQLLGRLAQHLWAQGRWHDVPGPVRHCQVSGPDLVGPVTALKSAAAPSGTPIKLFRHVSSI